MHSIFERGCITDFTYDAIGRITHDGKRDFAWTSFGQLKSVNSFNDLDFISAVTSGDLMWNAGMVSTSFEHGIGGQRLKQSLIRSGKREDTYYLGAVELTKRTNLSTGHYESETLRQHVGGICILESSHKLNFNTQLNDYVSYGHENKTSYLLKDHLGSVTTILDEEGMVVESSAFDPWGKRLKGFEKTAPAEGERLSSDFTRRGFTGHEMLDEVGLIHMNGRIYNAHIGRFLSADPFVQAPTNTQNFTRYSYVTNNPLSITDPSGFIFGWIAKQVKSAFNAVSRAVSRAFSAVSRAVKRLGRWVAANARQLASIAVTAVLYVAIGPGATFVQQMINGAIIGASSGAFSAAINGGDIGDIIKGAVVGGISGAILSGPVHNMGASVAKLSGFARAGKAALHSAAHGVVGGVRSVAMGGKFKDGFISGAAGAGVSHVTTAVDVFQGDGAVNLAGRTTVAAVGGGAATAIAGGKFANGAYTATFGHLLNAEMKSFWDKRPGFWESVIPVWGPAKTAVADFRAGRVGWGIFNSVLAITDLIPIRAVAGFLVKFGWKSIVKVGSHTWKNTRAWMGRRGMLAKGQHGHHWFFRRNEGIGKHVPDSIKNQPWNIMPMKSSSHHTKIHGGTINNSSYSILERIWHGTPSWFKAGSASSGGRATNWWAYPEEDSR